MNFTYWSVDRYLLGNLISQLNLPFGEATEHISLEDDQFNQHSFKLPGFKSTDLKTTLSSLTALWTSQMHLSNLDFSTLLVFDRELENPVFSSGFWFWTKSKFEVKFCPQSYSHAIESMLLHGFTSEEQMVFRKLSRIQGVKGYSR